MTEFWKSNAMYWCDVCKVWLQDTKQHRLNHERGMQHQAKLKQKLRDMARKADEEKAHEKNFQAIEDAAKKKYEDDLKAVEAANGKWVWDEKSNYYYNAAHRWYYDPKSGWYYGGEPTEWSMKPTIPASAMFGVAPHEGGPVAPIAKAPPATATATASTSAATANAQSVSSSTTAAPNAVAKKLIEVPKHPLADVGGYQSHHLQGKVGGAKGIGSNTDITPGEAVKRKRDEELGKGKGAGQPLDPKEEEARARREAARARVMQRSAASFGFG